jgi:hypothetical protein
MPATIGHAQKVWTIFTKHLWCHGVIGDPGLCPVDRRMRNISISELERHPLNPRAYSLKTAIQGVAWTKMNPATYFDFLRAEIFCASALGVSVSVWELDRFSGGTGVALGAPVAVLKANFLTQNRWAANPGAGFRQILQGAFDDMWNSSHINGSRNLGPRQTPAQRVAVRSFIENWLTLRLNQYNASPHYGTMPFAVREVNRLLRDLKSNFPWL